MNARAFRLRSSKSFARRRQRFSQPMVRSTTQRLGNTSNPLARSERLTISTDIPGIALANASRNFGPLIPGIGEQLPEDRVQAKQRRHNQYPAIPILNIGRVDHRVHQQARGVDHDMALLAADFLARIIAFRIDAGPPFSALFTLWLSMIQAVGLGFRSAAPRHFW
jgi:hypothetical protein